MSENIDFSNIMNEITALCINEDELEFGDATKAVPFLYEYIFCESKNLVEKAKQKMKSNSLSYDEYKRVLHKLKVYELYQKMIFIVMNNALSEENKDKDVLRYQTEVNDGNDKNDSFYSELIKVKDELNDFHNEIKEKEIANEDIHKEFEKIFKERCFIKRGDYSEGNTNATKIANKETVDKINFLKDDDFLVSNLKNEFHCAYLEHENKDLKINMSNKLTMGTVAGDGSCFLHSIAALITEQEYYGILKSIVENPINNEQKNKIINYVKLNQNQSKKKCSYNEEICNNLRIAIALKMLSEHSEVLNSIGENDMKKEFNCVIGEGSSNWIGMSNICIETVSSLLNRPVLCFQKSNDNLKEQYVYCDSDNKQNNFSCTMSDLKIMEPKNAKELANIISGKMNSINSDDKCICIQLIDDRHYVPMNNESLTDFGKFDKVKSLDDIIKEVEEERRIEEKTNLKRKGFIGLIDKRVKMN